jgi:hypothetical protein
MFLLCPKRSADRRGTNQKVRERQRPNGAEGVPAPEAYTILLCEVKIDNEAPTMDGGRASSISIIFYICIIFTNY